MKFYRTKTRKDVISWMLMLAFVSLTLLPSHYHFHHVADASVQVQAPERHEHARDVHRHTALDALDHRDDGHVIKSVADAPLKAHGAKLSWILALMTFLLFLPFVAQATRLPPQSLIHRLPRSNRHNSPPLRAPPRA